MAIVNRRAGIIAAVIVGGVAVFFAVRGKSDAPAAAKPDRPVPVVVATVRKADEAIYRIGLGTVQAFYKVTIRSRVEGELEKLAVTEGMDVKAGDLIAQIDSRQYKAALAQAVAQSARDQAQLDNAKAELARIQTLTKRDFATHEQLDAAVAAMRQFEAAVQGDKAAIDNAQVQLDYTTIRSPLSGRTGIRLMDPGNIVHPTDVNGLIVISQLQPISVVFTLPSTEVGAINKASARGPLTVEVWNQSDTEKLDEGALLLVDNEIETDTGTVRLKATLPNAERQLWPGAFVNAHLRLDLRHEALSVPTQAVQRGRDGLFVWLVQPDKTVAPRPVKVGQTLAGRSLIEDGLEQGQTVVVDGQYRLRTGAHVEARDVEARDVGAADSAGQPQ
jgi:multidrug efflux system membrane fusion protein